MRQRHKQLEKEGWIRQFVANGPLAKDAVEIYDLLGYEVHLQPPKRTHSKKKQFFLFKGTSRGMPDRVHQTQKVDG
jgi:hypothetical protein